MDIGAASTAATSARDNTSATVAASEPSDPVAPVGLAQHSHSRKRTALETWLTRCAPVADRAQVQQIRLHLPVGDHLRAAAVVAAICGRALLLRRANEPRCASTASAV